MFGEGRCPEESLHKTAGIGYKFFLLLRCIPFGQKNQIHLLVRITLIHQLRDPVRLQPTSVNKNTAWPDIHFQQRMKLHIFLISCRQFKDNIFFRIRNGYTIAPRLRFLTGLHGGPPLLEQSIESLGINQFATGLVINLHTISAIPERIHQIDQRSAPNRFLTQLFDSGRLLLRVSAQRKIYPQTFFLKECVEFILGNSRQDQTSCHKCK